MEDLPTNKYYQRRRKIKALEDKIKLLEKENKRLKGIIESVDNMLCAEYK